MTAAIDISGRHPIIFKLRELKLSNLARETFGVITVQALESGQCWIYRKDLAEYLHCAKESISRAITELVKTGLLRKTGEMYLGQHPYVEITPLGKEYISKAENEFAEFLLQYSSVAFP